MVLSGCILTVQTFTSAPKYNTHQDHISSPVVRKKVPLMSDFSPHCSLISLF